MGCGWMLFRTVAFALRILLPCFLYFLFFLASYLRNAQNLPVKYGHASERALNNLFTGTSKSYDPAMIPKYLNLGF